MRGKRIVIAGGGDSAVDWALSLAEVAASITVVHRRDKFRAVPANVAAMQAHPKIALKTPYQLSGLTGEDGELSKIMVSEIGGGPEPLEADTLLALFGLASDLSPLAGLGIDISGKTIAVEASTCETSRTGIHAIGDVADYPGKLKLILTGFSEAATAAHAAHARVFPGKAIHSEYSTTRGVPGISPEPALMSA
jgi:thioredoxin reductase (NADPH)